MSVRIICRVVAVALLGALTLSDVAVADEKNPSKKESYNEKAIVRKWDGTKFLKAVADQPAFIADRKGKIVIFLLNPAGNTMTPKGSEITIGDTTYVVDKGSYSSAGYYESIVTPKPKDK